MSNWTITHATNGTMVRKGDKVIFKGISMRVASFTLNRNGRPLVALVPDRDDGQTYFPTLVRPRAVGMNEKESQ